MQFILVSVLLIVIAIALNGYRSNTVAATSTTSSANSSNAKKRKLSSSDRASDDDSATKNNDTGNDSQRVRTDHGQKTHDAATYNTSAPTDHRTVATQDNVSATQDNVADATQDNVSATQDNAAALQDDASFQPRTKSSYLSFAAKPHAATQSEAGAKAASTAITASNATTASNAAIASVASATNAVSSTSFAASATATRENAIDTADDQTELTTTATSAASSPSKNPPLLQCFRKFEPIAQNAISTTQDYLAKIPPELQNCEELVFSLIVQHIQTKQVNYTDVDVAVSRICTGYMWPLLSYLVTVLSPNRTVLRRIAKNVIRQTLNMTDAETSPAQLDMLFVTMMLTDSNNRKQPAFQPTDVFVDHNRYLFDPHHQRSRTFASSLKLMLADQYQLITAELRNRLDHRRAAYDVSLYMRYWQMVALEELHPAYAKVQPDHCVFVRNLCFQTHCTPIGAPYELLSLQTLIHLASRDPTWFNDEQHTQDKFVLWFDDQLIRAINPSRAFLPSFLVHLSKWLDTSATSPLLAVTAPTPDAPNTAASTTTAAEVSAAATTATTTIGTVAGLQYHEAVYNQMSLQVTLAHTAWKHQLTINRPNAPLPVHFNSINSYAGRVYLSDGVTHMVLKMDNVFGGVLRPTDSVAAVTATHSRVEPGQVMVFTLKLDQPMLERWTESVPQTVPFLKLRGVTSIDNKHGNLVVHLRTRGSVEPLGTQTRSYVAWLSHLFAAYFNNTNALSWHNFAAMSPQNNNINQTVDLPMLRAQRYFRLACEVYSAAIDRVKTENMQNMHKYRVNRRKMRKLLSYITDSIKAQRSAQALCHKVDERFWYDDVRYTEEEPIDFTSTYLPSSVLQESSERIVSAAEAYLWIELRDFSRNTSHRFKRVFAEAELGTILRTRLSGMILLADVAINVHSLQHFLYDPVYRMPSDDAVDINATDKSVVRLRELVEPELSIFERLNRPVDETVRSKKICEIPVSVIVYERPLYQLDLVNEHQPEHDYLNVVSNSDRGILPMSELRVTVDRAAAGKSSMHIDLLMSYTGKLLTLKPLEISPHVLMRDSLASIEKQYPHFDESVFSIANVPEQLLHDLGDTSATSVKPLSIYLWFPRVAADAGRFDNLEACMVNPISLRVSSARQHNFKLINVLWEGTQYLVVKQESHTHCVDHEKSGLNLWYGINTNPDIWSTNRFYGVTHTVALRPPNNQFYTLLQRNNRLPATSPRLYLTDKDDQGVEVSSSPRVPYTRQVFRSLLAVDPDETLPSQRIAKDNGYM